MLNILTLINNKYKIEVVIMFVRCDYLHLYEVDQRFLSPHTVFQSMRYTMKFNNVSPLLALVMTSSLVTGMSKTVSADIITGHSLGAQSVVTAFNSMSNPSDTTVWPGANGYYFMTNRGTQPSDFVGLSRTTYGLPTQNFDTSAYYPSSESPALSTIRTLPISTFSNNFSAFPVAGYARLNYQNGTTSMQSGVNLSVGAAYLYAQFATTNLYNTIWGSSDLTAFATAIRFLNGQLYQGTPEELALANWGNPFLQQMLMIDPRQGYWMSAYNPDAYYEEIGNYSVFVMQAIEYKGDPNNPPAGPLDFLYVVNAANPYFNDPTPGVPEPATILLWGTGMMLIPLSRRLRKK